LWPIVSKSRRHSQLVSILVAGGDWRSYEGVEAVEFVFWNRFGKEADDDASEGAGSEVEEHLPGEVDFGVGGLLHYESEGLCGWAASYE